MFLLCTLVLPYDIGSGALIVNPYRVATAVLTVGCVIVYALLRIWTDPAGTPTRRVVLSLSFVVTVVALVLAHQSVRGRRRLPPFEMRFEFWRFVVIAAATVLIACAFCWASWLLRKRSDVRA
jgi:cytochrome bd-type quinol oxidase subunit 2